MLKNAMLIAMKCYKVLDDYRKQVKLTIEHVEQFHFSSYHLSAMNDISTAEVTIILLPASLELSQIPSAQDQMMYFLQQQQMPETSMMTNALVITICVK